MNLEKTNIVEGSAAVYSCFTIGKPRGTNRNQLKLLYLYILDSESEANRESAEVKTETPGYCRSEESMKSKSLNLTAKNRAGNEAKCRNAREIEKPVQHRNRKTGFQSEK